MRLGYTAVEYVELGLEAMEVRELEADLGTTLLHVTGAIDAGYDDELAAVEAAYRTCSVPFEWLGADAAAERWPGLRFEGPVLHQPDGGWVRADLALDAFLDGAARRGALLRFESPVMALERTGDGVRVVTDDGSVITPVVVVAAGAWAPDLLTGLLPLPALTVTEELVAYFRRREPDRPWPCFIHRGTPLLYGLPGPHQRIKVGEHQTGPVVHPDERTFELQPEAWQRLRDVVEHWLPGVDPEPVDAVTCLYATGPGDDLVLDRVGPVVVASGLGGHGFKFGPALGRSSPTSPTRLMPQVTSRRRSVVSAWPGWDVRTRTIRRPLRRGAAGSVEAGLLQRSRDAVGRSRRSHGQERHQAARQAETSRDDDAGPEPLAELLLGAGQVEADDAGQHGDGQQPGQAGDRVVHARGDAEVPSSTAPARSR